MVSCHKYNLKVEVKSFIFGSLKDSKLQVVHRDHVGFVAIVECVSFSVPAELSLEEDEEEDEGEGRKGDLKEDVQEGKTVFVRSEHNNNKKENDLRYYAWL